MCRFLAYRGRAITMDQLLYQPKNSLIQQSACAHEAEEPLNGDGFGVGWYNKNVHAEPGLYVSIRPAWNDKNLKHLAKHIYSNAMFAHVRAASEGEVSEANCHPFHYNNYLFMHNGGLGEFAKIKRYIRRDLSDDVYNWVRGQTDSEHFFAMIIEELKRFGEKPSAFAIAEALEATIKRVQKIKSEHGIEESCFINCVLTDGQSMVAVRYVSDPAEKASTLYYSEGHHYDCEDGVCVMRPGEGDHSVLIVSEKLTDNTKEWKEIPTNHVVIIDEKMKVHLRPIDVPQVASNKATSGRGFDPRRRRAE